MLLLIMLNPLRDHSPLSASKVPLGASWDYEYATKLVYFCNDEIELHSYNEKYDTMTYPLSAVRSAKKIVYVIHKS